MTSSRNKIWMRMIAALVVMAFAAAPVAAVPQDGASGSSDLGITSAWQLLVDGWDGLLAAVGMSSGSDPVPVVDDGSTTESSPTPPTPPTEPGDGSTEGGGIMDPDG